MTILLTTMLLAIAGLHIAWGLGHWVPLGDEGRLAKATVGFNGVAQMPGLVPCLFVAAAICVIVLALWTLQFGVSQFVAWAAAAVFLLRGLAAYLPHWQRLTPEQPFRDNDARYYGPLCIALGLGILVVLQGG